MPEYRDHYPPRRPPDPRQRQPYGGSRQTRGGYPPRPQGTAPNRPSGGYIGSRNEGSRNGYRDSRDPRPTTPLHVHPTPNSEYLADTFDDRYSAQSPQPAAGSISMPATDDSDWFADERSEVSRSSRVAQMTSYSAAPSADSHHEDDDFDDVIFDDSDFGDSDDDWFSEHSDSHASSAYGRSDVRTRSSDEFDEGNDPFYASQRQPQRRANTGGVRYEDDEAFSVYRGAGSGYPGAFTPQKNSLSAKSRNTLIISICGILVTVGVVLALMLFSNRGSGVVLPVDLVLDSITAEQSETIVGSYVDRRVGATVCRLTVDGQQTDFRLSDCGITYVGDTSGLGSEYFTDTDELTGELRRIEFAYSGVFCYNRTVLQEKLNSLLGSDVVPVVDPYYEIDYDAGVMTLHHGTDGYGVEPETFISKMTSALGSASGNSISVSCSGGVLSAKPLNASDIYNSAVTEPANAYTTTDSAGNTVYHSEINGVSFSLSSLEQLIASGSSALEMPVTVTFPEINLKDIRKYTFPDVLSSYYTYYSKKNAERSHNLSLAAENINSLILEPGEQFSFNETVGERTAANGFKIAGVYSSEGTSEDYGGGICQTSSTLYYACILANLQIDDRTNHIYTVSYMQTATTRQLSYGNDATVNWGTIDFKFTNNKEYPIRIDIWAEDGTLYCEIRGTADGLTADFQYNVTATTPYMIKYLPANGEADQKGQSGYTIKAYRVVYQDGVKIDSYLESTNTYKPLNKIFYTNELPAGFEYGVEYDQNYTPPTEETAPPDILIPDPTT